MPTSSTAVVLGVSGASLERERSLIERRGLTPIGVALSGLVDRRHEQLMLPLQADRQPLDEALDTLRARFGTGATTRGSLIGRDTGLEVPPLPE